MDPIRSLTALAPAGDWRSPSEIEQEIADELEFHLAMRTEEYMNQGMSADAARAAALAQFGDLAAVQQKCRRALLGARIMWQRIQMALSIVLLAAVVLLAVQLYSGQQANRAAIDNITSALKQLAPAAAGGGAPASGEEQSNSGGQAATSDPNESYPIAVKGERAREFTSLAVDFSNLTLRGEMITAVPISTEVGVTGVFLLGNGTYSYAPEGGKKFDGQFHAAMLRFNPKDADSIIKLSAGKAVVDKGAGELAQAIVAATFRHCYHRGEEALIPPAGAIAADVFFARAGRSAAVGQRTNRCRL
jgi:hypothetical protein